MLAEILKLSCSAFFKCTNKVGSVCCFYLVNLVTEEAQLICLFIYLKSILQCNHSSPIGSILTISESHSEVIKDEHC